jgi:hypothetical protein
MGHLRLAALTMKSNPGGESSDITVCENVKLGAWENLTMTLYTQNSHLLWNLLMETGIKP